MDDMAEDYYKILGVPRGATAEEIQKAYRKLARKCHPDLNPDDPSAKKKFQELQGAFDVLNDPQKRSMYDQFGEAAFGGGPQGGGAPRGGARPGVPPGFENIDLSELFGGGMPGGFADLFGQAGRGRAGGPRRRRAETPSRGADLEASVEVPLSTAVLGGETSLLVQRNDRQETIRVKVPRGIDEGKKIRLRGQGNPSGEGGPPGDLLLTVHVTPHPHFHRRGANLHLKLPITLGEAIEGAKVDVPTPQGTVALRVPPGSSSGTKLRIKGHGVSVGDTTGDLLVECQVVLPSSLSDDERQWLREFETRHPLNPRDKVHW